MTDELLFVSIAEIHRLYGRREVSSVEIVDATLARGILQPSEASSARRGGPP